MAVTDRPPVEITPELLAQAVALIQQQQEAGEPPPSCLPGLANPGAPIVGAMVAPNGGDHMFYRQPNGWVTSGQMGKAKSRMFAYQNEGWTPLLDAYGLFDLGYDYYSGQPLEVLLIRGGAKELPTEQILAFGWHLHPPTLPNCRAALGVEHRSRMGFPKHTDLCWRDARPVDFPQLRGQSFTQPPECEFCDRDDFASSKVRDQHIRVAHKDEMKDIAAAREMAKSVGEVMAAHGAMKGTPLPAPARFTCGSCSEGFDKIRGPDGLESHARLCSDDPEGEAATDAA
jgi:hypothetical protein